MLRGLLLVILLIRRRDREPLKFMGHDLKQFKSLEGNYRDYNHFSAINHYLTGFLESGPQFVLQSYILMIGQKRNTNIDFNDIKKEDATRLGKLLDVMMFTLSNINFQPY